MATERTRLPDDLVIGDACTVYISLPEYNPSDYTLKVELANGGQQCTATATDNGDGRFKLSISSSDWDVGGDLASMTAGVYKYQMSVTDVSDDRVTVDFGRVNVLPNFASTPVDARDHVEKVLDALEATILGKASSDQIAYTIAGRSLSRLSPSELIRWRSTYRVELRYLKDQERLRQGRGSSRRILGEF